MSNRRGNADTAILSISFIYNRQFSFCGCKNKHSGAAPSTYLYFNSIPLTYLTFALVQKKKSTNKEP